MADKKQYPIVDSIAKGYLIDGTATFVVLSVFYGSRGMISMPMIALTSVVHAGIASVAYLIRTDARENGHPGIGGVEGGSFKCIGREVAMSSLVAKEKYDSSSLLMIKGLVGGANNYLYELCASYESCRGSIPANYALATTVEALDASIIAIVGEGDVLMSGLVGGIGGFIGASFAFFVYFPLIEPIHQTYDIMEARFNQLYDSIILGHNYTNTEF